MHILICLLNIKYIEYIERCIEMLTVIMTTVCMTDYFVFTNGYSSVEWETFDRHCPNFVPTSDRTNSQLGIYCPIT